MEFRDLKKQYQQLKPQMDAAIQQVLHDANFISGKQVVQLEEKLAEYVGVKHCITCGNGTDALSLVMMAWDIKEGDAVFVPDFTFFASAEVVSFEGATPVFVDVDERTFNLDPDQLEKAIAVVKQQGKLTGVYDIEIVNQQQKIVALFRGKSHRIGGTITGEV